ncbi:DciA family protein [Kitasatospora sp. NPDC004723]|uniref:DciA family protein n=1 Tax=Kitasatospora sp. NPDC004723 TaxID=3154288 RepID=UPI0033A431C0
MTPTPAPAPTSATGADLARTALRAARQTARTHGNAPAPRTARAVRPATAARRGPREPELLAEVFLALVAAHGWTLGTAGGGLRDHWPAIVGPDAAAHWHLAGYDPTTRRLRVTADSPAWAAQLRLHLRRILTALEQLRPGTVRAIDVRVSPAPAPQPDHDADERPAPRPAPTPPARAPLADHTAYQELRRQMREQALARQAALDEATAQREAILTRHYNRLREPEDAHRTAIETTPAADTNDHDRQQRARHRAALAVARATRTGTIPLRTARQPQPAPARGAA